jgi:anti-sigma factor (TIGR02949 family)
MTECASIREQIAFLLDGELERGDRERLERHLGGCPGCRAALEAERAFLERVRGAAPLYAAPPELRARVEAVLADAPGPCGTPERLRRRVLGMLAGRAVAARWEKRQLRVAAVAAVLLVLAAGAIVGRMRALDLRRRTTSEFALMAVDAHVRYVRGQLPLEVATGSAARISLWFDGKVPFGLRLPNYQEASGQERLYELEGARLVGFKGDYAAYVAYRMGTRPISLVVTSSAVAEPYGGEEIVSRGLLFHYDAIDGLKVITWSDHGLTYALVSDLEERGQQSCVICHQGTRDRDFIETLKP